MYFTACYRRCRLNHDNIIYIHIYISQESYYVHNLSTIDVLVHVYANYPGDGNIIMYHKKVNLKTMSPGHMIVLTYCKQYSPHPAPVVHTNLNLTPINFRRN